MSAIEDSRAAIAAAEETARTAAKAAEQAKADLKAAREEEKRLMREEAARVLSETVANKRGEYDATFGVTSEWIGAEIELDGDLGLSVFRYANYEGSVAINREAAIALRDFLNDRFKD